jgi:prepilin-type processing-associated H-X9-DG protein
MPRTSATHVSKERRMTVDLTGGLPLSREDVLVGPPEDPQMREGVNVWLHDDAGRFSLPRIGVEAVSETWARPAVQANMAFADGRVLIGSCVGDAHDRRDEAGRPTVIGAGPMSFRCEEPFRRWTMTYLGDALDTTIADQVAGRIPDGPRVDVEIQVDMAMVVPPWIQGEMGERARALLKNGKEGLFMGGDRYEQLFKATGSFRVGDDTIDFTGTGLRIHRQGVRNTGEFRGHCWQTAVFPSGKAFGYIAFPDNDDGTQSYREGFVFDGERMRPATVVDAPWTTNFEPSGGRVPLVLESELGTHQIDAVTTCTTAIAGTGNVEKVAAMVAGKPLISLFFHQGSARYEWDGEVAQGMIERSLPIETVQR